MKRKQKRREEKNARREAERTANLQMTGSGSSPGSSIDMGSSISGFTAGNSDETQSSVTNYSDEKESYVTRYTSRKKLPKNIVEIITILESSDSEDEKILRPSSGQIQLLPLGNLGHVLGSRVTAELSLGQWIWR